MKKRTTSSGVLAALFLVASPVAAGHPTTLGEKSPVSGLPGDGYPWVAASWAFRADGSVRDGLGSWVETHLEWVSRHDVADHGLKDGVPSQTQEFCPPIWLGVLVPPSFVFVELSRLDSTLLLSEIAATAVIAEAIPGFDEYGQPAILFSLSDGAPLHGRSRIPSYILAPVNRMVYQGRVFCRRAPAFWREELAPPAVGDRVVVIGNSAEGGVVRFASGTQAILGLIDGDEKLRWPFPSRVSYKGGFPDAPESLSALQGRVDEAVAGGLFDMFGHLAFEAWGSPGRRAFGEMWERHNTGRCRVTRVETRPGYGVVPVEKWCDRPKAAAPRADPQREEDAPRNDHADHASAKEADEATRNVGEAPP